MEYQIIGGSFPAVSCKLQNGEAMISEGGSMIWMTPNVEMTTQGGGLGKIFSRAFSGENLFQNIYTSHGQGIITFGSSFPGKILTLQIAPGKDIILQKSSFLASEIGVELSIHFNKKFGVGFFGGEGFIMQRLSGHGIAFAEVAGDLMEYTLESGRQLVVGTGNLVGFESTVQMDIRQVQGLKNKFFGGEGFFNTILTGPGKVWIQTTSISGMAAALAPYLPSSNND